MEQENLLEQNQKAASPQPEKKLPIPLHGETFNLIFVFVVGIVLSILKRNQGLPSGDVLAMVWACALGCFLFRVVNGKRKLDSSLALFSLVMLAFNLYQYFTLGQ